VEEFASELGRAERRYWCKRYLRGLLLDGEHKSIEPMAQRVPGGNEQALQQFVKQSPWAHEPVQAELSRRLVRRDGAGKGVLGVNRLALRHLGDVSSACESTANGRGIARLSVEKRQKIFPSWHKDQLQHSLFSPARPAPR
jgi:hypothetical protein